MKIDLLAAFLLAASLATTAGLAQVPAAQRPPVPGVPGVQVPGAQRPQVAPPQPACPYQPGAVYSAEIRIAVKDAETPADSAVVRLNGRIPPQGRTAAGERGAARYIVALPAMPVQLEKNTLKHFNIAPRIVVENADSPQCQLRLESTVGERGWALDKQTDFTIETTVMIAGRQETTRSSMFVSCFDEDSPILMASGESVRVKELIAGDIIWNPVLKRASRVSEVIQGTEADETLYRIGYGGSAVLFTGQHPIFTRNGLRPASKLTREDFVLGEDGAFHPVSVLEVKTGDPSRLVYNLKLEAPDAGTTAHLLSVGGIVAGDFTLQQDMRAEEISRR